MTITTQTAANLVLSVGGTVTRFPTTALALVSLDHKQTALGRYILVDISDSRAAILAAFYEFHELKYHLQNEMNLHRDILELAGFDVD